MTAITSPVTFAQTQGDLGYAYVFGEQEIRRELAESLNLVGLGLVQLVGNVANTGSDVIRIDRIGGIGYAEAMATMGTEIAPITLTGLTTGYDTVTVARHGLAKSDSYSNQIQGRRLEAKIAGMRQQVVPSWIKTMRQKVATAGAGITDVVGTSGALWTFDDELDLIAYFNETEGFQGDAITLRHPEQFTQLRESIRNEPNFQFPDITLALQGLKAGGGFADWLGLRNHASFDVTASGGDHQGFAYAPGAIGWAVGSTENVEVENAATTMFIGEFGLVIETKSDGNIATSRFDANAWFGVGTCDPSVAPQVRIRSLNT